MSKVKIITDSTSDLSRELIEAYDIGIIPLMITLGDVSKKDGTEITPKEIYEWSDKTGETPKTAAPMLGDAAAFLTPYAAENRDCIFIGISEEMSATCNVMILAAESIGYQKLHVVNSKNLSTGIGLQVIRAAELAKEGFGVEEILKDINSIIDKVRASFVIDTLTFLHRGGRCSGVAALFANTLKLKPEIVVKEGKMQVSKKYRGNIRAVLPKYCRDKEEALRNAEPSRVFITHSGCEPEVVNEVSAYLKELNVFNEIIETKAGGVISSHCGPNTLGVLFISKD